MRKMLRWLVLLAVTLVAAGCGLGKGQVPAPQVQAVALTPQAQVSVYLDGTLSMQGYANFPTDSGYAVALKSIEQALNVTWKDIAVNYYRFGDETKPLSRAEFLQASTPGFYHDNETKLQDVIATLQPQQLNVLVTDLFQTDQDVQAVITAVNDRFLREHEMVALLGMTSRFNGRVYDIGNEGAQFPYQTTEDPASYRPFYFLVLGPQADVLAFVQAYRKILPEQVPGRLLVYGEQLGTEGKLAAAHADLPAGTRTFAATNSLVAGKGSYLQYLLKDHPGIFLLDYELKLPYAMQVAKPEFVLEQLEFYQGGKFVEIKAAGFTKTSLVQAESKALALNCRVRLDVDPSKLPEHGVYRARVALRPSLANYRQVQQVFKDWNMDAEKLSTWNADNFPGQTTFNVNKFTNNLAEVAYASLHPAFAVDWLYFKY